MKLVINSESKIQKLIVMFKVLKQVTNMITVYCDKDKLYIQALDPAKISIADYTLYAKWFDEYEIDNDTHFGVNTSTFCSVLGYYIENGKLTLEFSDDSDKLCISYDTDDEKAIVTHKTYNVPLIDIESDLLSMPDLEYEADLGMSLSLFNSIISEISSFSSGINFNIDEDSIKFKTRDHCFTSEDKIDCETEINIDIENVDEFSIDEDCKINVSFTTSYISYVSNFVKIFKNVKIGMSNDMPLQLLFEEEDNYTIKLYVAPAIDE